MTPEALDLLIRGYLAGTLTPAEAGELQAHLDAHPADAARLIDASDEDLLFREAFQPQPVSGTARLRKVRSRRLAVPTASAPAWGVAVAAAGIVAALIAFAALRGGNRELDEFVRTTNARRSLAER